MKVIRTYYRFEEIQVDEHGEEAKRFTQHLPHAKEIVRAAVKSWNDTVIPDYFDDHVKNKILSCKAAAARSDPDAMVVSVKTKPGITFTTLDEEYIRDDIDAQFSDGWGESFFGQISLMQDGNTRYYPD